MPGLEQDATVALSHLWRQILTDIADRNAGVDLMPWHLAEQDASQPVPDRFRARLLAVEPEGQLIIQQPAQAQHRRWLDLGAWVGVLVVLNNQRWLGRCQVTDLDQTFVLNARSQVSAVHLDAATEVRSSQRRGAYRAQTHALNLPPARLWAMPPAQSADDAPPAADAAPVEATLLNVSASGLGLAVVPTGQPVKQLLESRRYHCRFTLPGFADEIDIVVRLVHARPQPDRTVYLGLTFEFDSAGHRQQFADRLARFTAHLERETLRRRRGA